MMNRRKDDDSSSCIIVTTGMMTGNSSHKKNRSLPATATTAWDLWQQQQQQQEDDDETEQTAAPQLVQTTASTSRQVVSWLRLGLGITEIAGEAGTGKTQVALSLSAQVAQQQGGGGVLYICGPGGKASLSRLAFRLEQIIRTMNHHDHENDESNAAAVVLSKVWFRSMRNEDEFMDFITQQENDSVIIHRNHEIKLLVVDSLADLFRHSTCKTIQQRSQFFFQLAAQLKRLSQESKIRMVILNQVTATNFSSNNSNNNNNHHPALGLSWASCVNTRYMLTREQLAGENDTQQYRFLRQIRLDLSSQYPIHQRISFQIEKQGLVATKDYPSSGGRGDSA